MGKKIAKKYESESEEDFDDEGYDQQLDEEEDDQMDVENSEQEEEDYQSNSDILDNEDDSEGSEVQVNRGADFGKKKNDYYKGSDVTDSDDSAEEEGAEQVYRENQNALTEADFMDEDFRNQESQQQSEEDEAANLDAEKAKVLEQEKKQKLVKKLSPEIISLAQEMNISISEITDKLFPILDVEEAKKILPGKGQNFLEIRYELLISYTICILFYLLLKAKGKITNNHPVLDKLTKYKTMIERMNISIDDFETQVGKIIAKNLQSKKKGTQKGQKAMTFEEKMKLNKKTQNKNSKETEQQKLARELQQELKNMYGESEGDDEFDDFDQEEESENNLLSDDEEDVRITKGVQASKKQGKQQAGSSKKADNGEINMASIEPWMLDDEDEGDMLLQEPKKVDLNKMKKKEANKNVKNSEEFEDDFYKQVKQQQIDEQISRKKQKILEKEKKKEQLAKKYEIREVNEEESRKISTQILQNKGNLVRKRKDKSGNARVAYRQKFEKKQRIHNINHRGKIYDKQIHGYMGEMGAIKPSLIKSNKLA